MIRWRFVAAVALGVLLGIYMGAWLDAATGFHVRGTLTAVDDAGGRYALGAEFGLTTTPGSPVHPLLRKLVGQQVSVHVERRPPSAPPSDKVRSPAENVIR